MEGGVMETEYSTMSGIHFACPSITSILTLDTCTFYTPERSWALSNLQPMWKEDNFKKGNRYEN